MPTWSNLFDGYNVYNDVFGSYPNMYTQVSNTSVEFNLYDQIIKALPYDIQLLSVIFYTSIFITVAFAALLFLFLMPIARRAQQWK